MAPDLPTNGSLPWETVCRGQLVKIGYFFFSNSLPPLDKNFLKQFPKIDFFSKASKKILLKLQFSEKPQEDLPPKLTQGFPYP